jgi:hypothetical protein
MEGRNGEFLDLMGLNRARVDETAPAFPEAPLRRQPAEHGIFIYPRFISRIGQCNNIQDG